MKIALLMSGDCRQMWLTAPSLYRNVIDPNNADMFLCLNKDSLQPLVDNEEEIVRQIFPRNVKSLVFASGDYHTQVDDLIKSNYAKIDGFYSQAGRSNWDKQLNHHNTDQYFKLRKCAEAAVAYATENGFKYDLMLRCRPDIGWLNHFDLLRGIAPEMLYVNYSDHDVVSKNYPWVEDTCFFGDQDTMLKFCTEFSQKMVDTFELCHPSHDLTCATEKLLARVLLDSGINYTGIDNYFNYHGTGWIRPKLSKYFVDWSRSENYHLVEKFAAGSGSQFAVYFDRISENNIVMDPALIL